MNRNLRILLVEDHADTAQLLSQLLRGRGHEVSVAQSVSGALRAASENNFDVLVSDLGLPDGTGIDLIKQIRVQYGGITPALALTGYAMGDDPDRCREAGFNDHLAKPVSLDKLEAALQRLTCSDPPRVP